jgi:hypothetical protein
MNSESQFRLGPRDLMHSLSQLLSDFRGGNPTVLNILQHKLTRLGINVSSPQRLLQPSLPEEDHEE